jgi:hypothetical protein
MRDGDFTSEVQKLGLAMRVIATVDLDFITETVDHAHAVAPLLDPTKYRDALRRGDMDAIAELAQKLKEPTRIWREKIEPKIASEVA